jgi:hypothetical protein
MDLHDVRPAFYSEDVVSGSDYINISTVLAHKTKIIAMSENEWEINSPATVLINSGNPDISLMLDHKVWRAVSDENIIIPEGKHTLTLSRGTKDTTQLWIKNISGNLKKAFFDEKYVEFSYSESITSCYVIVSKHPASVFIDGKPGQYQVLKNEDGEYVLKLPEGTHQVRIESK